ncbi:GRF zinc finger domain containing protein [Ophiocordyceps camponoti-floridani]|uniref:GRF zinc finger domain containing protein n=1 Tax=Ophiocordyceps camponoti-floridani TaxID=2030778 RepID=A0A8H4Q618_9HYPO|nr:GRF zinc finger domain containing protein [Ophiocordyceps camponoti-floridani]
MEGGKRKFVDDDDDDETTEVKIAMLASVHPDVEPEKLLDMLVAHRGSIASTTAALERRKPMAKQQCSLRRYGPITSSGRSRKMKAVKKGRTLHVFDPVDVAEHTPCTVVHDFLPAEVAEGLLRELLGEAETFERSSFKLFDNVVESPHSAAFFVEGGEERVLREEYFYNGSKLTDVRTITPYLEKVKPRVQQVVNREIQHRIATHYPNGRKLRHQPPGPWTANSAFVNCYGGGNESVGWHSDQLTYLGPRAVIGSLSLGVTPASHHPRPASSLDAASRG